MTSFRSKMFVFFLKYRSLLRLQIRPKSPDTTIPGVHRMRKGLEKGSRLLGKIPPDINIIPLEIGEIYAEWVAPSSAPKDKAILYFHGGGYVVGSAQGHRAIVAKFAKGSATRALVFNYGLAPEHPFPEGLNDAVDAYKYLLSEGIESSKIVLMGDSAGSGLCLATTLALREQKIPSPAATIALFSLDRFKKHGRVAEIESKG